MVYIYNILKRKENINDEEDYANGVRYVIDILREWYVRKTFVEVNFSRRDAEF